MTGDADRVLQIASNLVENALRETPAGGTVTVEADGARLVVSDTGPGIPADDLPHAFERFYLYDKIGRDRLIGSGLGLAIVRQLATAMGGTVGVESGAGGHGVHGDATAAGRTVSTTSKSDPCSAPSACSWSFDQCGLGAPDTYQFEPLSARIIPYVFIA